MLVSANVSATEGTARLTKRPGSPLGPPEKRKQLLPKESSKPKPISDDKKDEDKDNKK